MANKANQPPAEIPIGRPSIGGKGDTPKRRIALSDDLVEVAKELGKGNLSEGTRVALGFVKARNLSPDVLIFVEAQRAIRAKELEAARKIRARERNRIKRMERRLKKENTGAETPAG